MKTAWRKVPRKIRRPIVLLIGGIFVVLSGLTGWLPGPGGIPLFLIGITILATEFAWAERLRDFVLALVFAVGRWMRRRWVELVFWSLVLCVVALFIYIAYV